MPIYYAVLARQRVVLADHAAVSGNFESLTVSILDGLQAQHSGDTRISYESGRYIFHVLIAQGLTFMCVTEALFDRSVAFSYLAQLQSHLTQAGLGEKASFAGPYALRRDFSQTMAELLVRFSSSDRLDVLSTKVEDVKGVMTENIEKVMQRGEALDDLQDRSEMLRQSSIAFRNNSTRLQKKLCWQKYKLWCILISVLLTIVLAIVVGVLIYLGATGKLKKS